MKKEVITLLLLGLLLILPLVLAQEQAQTYSGFDRFVDNVKMFFSSGDKKVMLALEIRGKELSSAIVNTNNGDDEGAEKNLERARERLQFVQSRVSADIAEDVKINVDETIDKIGVEEKLPKIFETYLLEEEKTQLTAELVIKVEGRGGQTLTRETVRDNESGKNKVKIVVVGESEQEGVMEIEKGIREIDNEIAKGINVVKTGMDIDVDKIDPDAGPKTPVPTDGSICCKKTMSGKTQYGWDMEEDCLNPATIKGEVMDNDVCVTLGVATDDEDDDVFNPGVPEGPGELEVVDED